MMTELAPVTEPASASVPKGESPSDVEHTDHDGNAMSSDKDGDKDGSDSEYPDEEDEEACRRWEETKDYCESCNRYSAREDVFWSAKPDANGNHSKCVRCAGELSYCETCDCCSEPENLFWSAKAYSNGNYSKCVQCAGELSYCETCDCYSEPENVFWSAKAYCNGRYSKCVQCAGELSYCESCDCYSEPENVVWATQPYSTGMYSKCVECGAPSECESCATFCEDVKRFGGIALPSWKRCEHGTRTEPAMVTSFCPECIVSENPQDSMRIIHAFRRAHAAGRIMSALRRSDVFERSMKRAYAPGGTGHKRALAELGNVIEKRARR
jgi:hypothetical protein